MQNTHFFRVYFKPFDTLGQYTDWIDVTKHITKLGNINVEADSQDYQIGVYRFSNFSISCNNRSGIFSDVDVLKSIFRYKRSDSLVKITYNIVEEDSQVGASILGDFFLSNEVTVFEGLLNDESYRFDFKSEEATFNILGYESMFDRVAYPYALSTIGDSIQTTIFNALNQTEITKIMTVDIANINVGLDQAIDDITWLEGKTAREALDKLLLVSNSVLYIKNETVYVTNRDATVDNKYTFYGQASQLGPENIINLKDYNNGLQRVFNFINWKDTTVVAQDVDSILYNGVRKVEVDFGCFTSSVKQSALMSELLTEFKDRKTELIITTKADYSTLALNLLDRVNIDYPIVYFETDFGLPVCGVAICGDPNTATLPNGQWALSIPLTKYFKILKKELDIKRLEISFKLREI